MYNILLVEDDKDIQEVNKYILEEQGSYRVNLAMNLAQARVSIAKLPLDIIILDIMLPDGSGLDFMTELRYCGNETPILLLTALSTPRDKVEGLRLGGNDYITKPYDFDEFLMRIEVILRNKQQEKERLQQAVTAAKCSQEMLTFGKLILNNTARSASLNGEPLGLTKKQVGLLLLLAKHINKTLTYDSLYETIWEQPLIGNNQALRSAVSEIRNKLAGSGYCITSERGIGYRFERGEYR